MEKPAMKRTLTNRNIQLIALGGAIGTGLFLGSAIDWTLFFNLVDPKLWLTA